MSIHVSVNFKDILHSYKKSLVVYCKFVRIYHQAMTFVTRKMLVIYPYN